MSGETERFSGGLRWPLGVREEERKRKLSLDVRCEASRTEPRLLDSIRFNALADP